MAKNRQPKDSTSYKETAFGIVPRSRLVALEKAGTKKAQQYILKLSKKNAIITPKLICEVHKRGFGFIFPNRVGKFRKINVVIGPYEPPHYSKVAELVRTLCDDLDERLKHIPPIQNQEKFLAETVSLLAWFQHQFVWIHPFPDYNGRVARLLTSLLALSLTLPIPIIKAETGKDRDSYINAMRAADELDYSKLENIIADALKESLKKV